MSENHSGNLSNIQTELERNKNALRTLCDELKLKVHLMSMDTRDMFQRVEIEVEKVEQQVGHRALQLANKLVDDLGAIARAIRLHQKQTNR